MRKYVINACFGGFSLPDEYLNMAGCQKRDEGTSIRTDPRLIEIVENPSYCGDLEVVCVPDAATDTYLVDYDGAETLLYVEDGLIYTAE